MTIPGNLPAESAGITIKEGIMTDQHRIAQLNVSLANAMVFYQRLRHFHWRVTGPHFFRLHEKFEELYDFWAQVADDIAERILALGGAPLPTLQAALSTATLKESEDVPDDRGMVRVVLEDLQAQQAQLRSVLDQAEQAGDRTTVNLLDGVLDRMEKDRWMLGALLAS